MATRYWVGNGGYWYLTTHWAETSGGAGGKSVPTKDDDVIFDSNSFTSDGQHIDLTYGTEPQPVKSLDFSSVTHIPTIGSGTNVRTFDVRGGSVAFASGMNVEKIALQFRLGGASRNLTTEGCKIRSLDVHLGTGEELNLLDDLTVDTFASFYCGTFNTNDHSFTVGTAIQIAQLYFNSYRTSMGAVYIDFGASQVLCDKLSLNTTLAELDAGTSLITCRHLIITAQIGDAYGYLVSESYDDATLYDLHLAGNVISQTISVQGSDLYINDLVIDDASTCDGYWLFNAGGNSYEPGGCYLHVSNDLTIQGASDKQLTLGNSYGTHRLYFIKSSGVVSISYTTPVYSSASGGAIFYAPIDDGNIDAGNNTGWIFTPAGEKTIVDSISVSSGFTSNMEDIGLPLVVDSAIDSLMEDMSEAATVLEVIQVAHWSDGGEEEHGDVDETINDGMMLYDNSLMAWLLSVDETLQLDDAMLSQLGIAIADWLTLKDTQTNNWNGQEIFTDTLNLYDIASFGKVITDTITESLVITDVATYKLVVGILEYLGFTDLATALKTMAESSTDSLGLTDGAERGFNFTINEALSAVDTVSVVATFLRSISDSLAIADTISNIKNIYGTISEALSFAEVITTKGALYTAVYDTIAMNVLIELADDVYECYVLNTPKFMPSMYSGFNFNSYCVFENRAFAANDDGIYELTGATDAGANISTGVIMSATDFGTPNQKRFRRGYIGISGTSPVMVLETEDGSREAYAIDTNGKFVASHDLKSKRWKLSVANFDELDTIKLIPVILTK